MSLLLIFSYHLPSKKDLSGNPKLILIRQINDFVSVFK